MTVIQVGMDRIRTITLSDINYVAVGTGTATPTSSDTSLQTETHRQVPTTKVERGDNLVIRTLIINADLPATVNEVGFFMNGTATPDSGQMLVRSLLTFTKGNQDLNLVFEITETVVAG